MADITVLIKPASGLCNMRCKYCFYCDVMNNRQTEQYGIMSEKTLATLVARAFEYADADNKKGTISLCWQGGEPTLAGLDFFKKAMELIQSQNKLNHSVENLLQTNGYNMNDAWAEFFHAENFLIGLSIDGFREAHDINRVDTNGKGTYARVLKAAEILRKHSVAINAVCVVNQSNARSPLKTYNSLRKAGFDFMQFIACIDDFSGVKKASSLDPKTYGNFLSEMFNLYYTEIMNENFISIRDFDNLIMRAAGKRVELCSLTGVCGGYFTVEADGSVYPCDFYVVDEWKMGNIFDLDFISMKNSDIAKKFIDMSTKHTQKCRECKYYPLCRSGCRRLRDNSGVLGENCFCESYKIFFENSVDKIFQLAKYVKK